LPFGSGQRFGDVLAAAPDLAEASVLILPTVSLVGRDQDYRQGIDTEIIRMYDKRR